VLGSAEELLAGKLKGNNERFKLFDGLDYKDSKKHLIWENIVYGLQE
jgi:hypothetical protein